MCLFSFQKNNFAAFLCIGFLGVFPLHGADLDAKKIVDDSSLRISIKDTWLTEVPAKALARRPEVRSLPGGGRVELRSEAEPGRDEFTTVLAREFNGSGIGAGRGSFPGWAQGSWVLIRRKDTGEATRIRVFLRSDKYTYVQFRPMTGDKCMMDVILYGAYLQRSLPLAIPFSRLYTMPLQEILALAGPDFPQQYFEPNPGDYRELQLFMKNLRQRLPEVHFTDDGAIDEKGRYVFIETLEQQSPLSLDGTNTGGLNCSGFAKWVVDGILKPVTGELLPITPLKQRFGDRGSSFTEPWEESRDPFFGLDWCRNLAERAWTTLRSPAYGKLEEFEVRNQRFSQVIVRGKNSVTLRAYPGFLPNAGFGTEGIEPLLYTLAVDEPGRIYLAAVNTEMGPPTTADNLRGRPRMRQYFHIAVLVPWFDGLGNFRVTVFESAEETSFDAFKTRYPGHYINLVRIQPGTAFEP
ncbi:MAG: hypothetical protein LBN21_10350 [Treponema sp.]|jgi:hypothetical protein|nr:hypothetical protein [Treponema sp.]